MPFRMDDYEPIESFLAFHSIQRNRHVHVHASPRSQPLQRPARTHRLSRPVPSAGQVLVRIAASGLNPLDTKIRAGSAAHAKHPLPLVLGIDMAGVVEAVGAGVTAFKAGDEVYGMTGGVGGIQGSLAQYAAVDAEPARQKPANLSMREAAALPLAFVTAYSGHRRSRSPASGADGARAGRRGRRRIRRRATGARARREGVGHGQHARSRYRRAPRRHADRLPRADGRTICRVAHAGRRVRSGRDTVGGATLDASFAAVKHFGHVVSALGWGTHALAPLSFREPPTRACSRCIRC